jgi:hypothetical protein
VIFQRNVGTSWGRTIRTTPTSPHTRQPVNRHRVLPQNWSILSNFVLNRCLNLFTYNSYISLPIKKNSKQKVRKWYHQTSVQRPFSGKVESLETVQRDDGVNVRLHCHGQLQPPVVLYSKESKKILTEFLLPSSFSFEISCLCFGWGPAWIRIDLTLLDPDGSSSMEIVRI